MSRRSWTTWVVGEPVERAVKQRNAADPDATDWYVDIACPNCGDVFEATKASVSKNKSHVCKAHLAKKKCNIPEEEREDDMSNATALPESKRARMTVVKHESCNKRIDSLRREMQENKVEFGQRIQSLETRRVLYDTVLRTCFPTLPLPLDCDSAIDQMQRALKTDVIDKQPHLTTAATTTLATLEDKRELETGDLRRDNVALKHKLELMERERDSMRSALVRGDDVTTWQNLNELTKKKVERHELCLLNLHRALRRHVLPAIHNEGEREKLARLCADEVCELKKDIAKLGSCERRVRCDGFGPLLLG